MKHYWLAIVVLLSCALAGLAAGAGPARQRLNLNRPDLKPGDEGERIILITVNTTNTSEVQGQSTSTNTAQFFELKGRETVVAWDTNQDLSKVSLLIERFVIGSDNRTNEPLRAGDHLVGDSLLGESFFASPDRPLSSEMLRRITVAYNIRPHNYNEFVHTTVPATAAVGETWNILSPIGAEGLQPLGISLTNNTIKSTGEFVGTTNLFGFDCFQLRFTVRSTETPEFLRRLETQLPMKWQVQIDIVVDVVAPFDPSKGILLKRYSMDLTDSSELVQDGKTVRTSRGRMSSQILMEYRPGRR